MLFKLIKLSLHLRLMTVRQELRVKYLGLKLLLIIVPAMK